MGLLGYLSEREVRLFGNRVHFDHYGIPTRAHDDAPK